MALPTQMIGGLISGLDTANIIEQLMTLERRPVTMLESRKTEHQTKLEAYRSVNSLLIEYTNAAGAVANEDIWNVKNTTSSNESALTATAGEYAQPGTYNFRVGRLAQVAQYTSGGFADRDTSPVSPGKSGTITIERGASKLNKSTKTNELNGGAGIYHGSLKITDASGNSAIVDLSTAETLDEVMSAINNTQGISVHIEVNNTGDALSGDSLIVTDTSGGAGTLKISDYGLGSTATDLGIAGSAIAGSINGSRINYMSGNTTLNSLRDGLGINNGIGGLVDFSDGTNNFQVDFSDATTIQSVIDKINAAATDAGSAITADISSDGKSLVISSSVPTDDITITDDVVTDSANTTASDLGIFVLNGGASVTGMSLISGLNTVRIASISGQDGDGDGTVTGINNTRFSPSQTLGTIDVTDGTNNVTVDLTSLDGSSDLSDLIREFNTQVAGAGISATMQVNEAGNGVKIVNTGGADVTITDNVGTVAADMGIENTINASSSLNGGDLDMNYISRATSISKLNNGSGITNGYFRITDTTGASAEFSTTGAKTVGQIIDVINSSGLKISASINETGDGIAIVESPDTGSANNIIIENLYGGTAATDLGIAGTGTENGAGISILNGSFEKTITVDQNDTLVDVMTKIADADPLVTSSIISDGSAYSPYRLVINSSDSGEAGDFIIDSDLSIFNFDQTAEGKNSILLYGQTSGSASPIMLTSSTNSNNTAVLGVTLDLHNVSSENISVTISEDTEGVTEAINNMVETFNVLQQFVSELDQWDSDEQQGGLLFADSATRSLMTSLSDQFFNTIDGVNGGLFSFNDIGLSFGDDGVLELDTSTLQSAISGNYEGVKELLTGIRNVARKDLNSSASASDSAGGGTSVSNLINGNTDSEDFGAANGYESANAIPSTGTSVEINFGQTKTLTRLVLNHINSSTMPAADYALKDFTVEYQTAAGQWETLRNVSGNKAAESYISFYEPTQVKALRITGYSTNAADGKFRMTEIEAYEGQGLALKIDNINRQVADSTTGFFAEQEDTINEKIADIDDAIASKEEMLEKVETNYILKYAAMESALAQLQAQGDFFAQQMDALTSNK
ncbi:MAG: flagellar filament capping protein FliD [Planctomycetes bacterium]|nr:flagellar filament capping protein FliD [Planctomycetota bacterium]